MELGSWTHLVGRFFDVASAKPLSEVERREVEAWLDGEHELALYWEQPVADQRHGLETARTVATIRPGRRQLIRAALLHDVGKRHAHLGVMGRSLASLFAKLRLPVRGSWSRYLEHGALGADEMDRIGIEKLVTEFARHHHGPRPAVIPTDDWEVLQNADR